MDYSVRRPTCERRRTVFLGSLDGQSDPFGSNIDSLQGNPLGGLTIRAAVILGFALMVAPWLVNGLAVHPRSGRRRATIRRDGVALRAGALYWRTALSIP